MSAQQAPGPGAPVLMRRQDFLGGLLMIVVSVAAFWLASDLAIGTLGGMGPGMLPKSLSVLLAALGVALLVSSVRERAGEAVHVGSLRGPLFVVAALVAFGLAVRPLGLVVAGPLAIVVSAFASDEVRWLETIVWGVLTTVFCVLLFKMALGLPIPLAPWLLGY